MAVGAANDRDQFPCGNTVKLRESTNVRLSELAGPMPEITGIPFTGLKIGFSVGVDAVR